MEGGLQTCTRRMPKCGNVALAGETSTTTCTTRSTNVRSGQQGLILIRINTVSRNVDKLFELNTTYFLNLIISSIQKLKLSFKNSQKIIS